MPSKWVPKRRAADVKQKRAFSSFCGADALRTTPFKECTTPQKYDDALRTVPFEQNTEFDDGVLDDEDAMSTSAGSSEPGLTDSQSSSFAETEGEDQNSNSNEISRTTLLLHRKYVSLSATPEYSLRTADVKDSVSVETELIIPPGLLPPPGLEDLFDPTEYAMFKVVATDTEELQSLLQKIGLELDVMTTSSTATVSEDESHLQNWLFDKSTATAADSNSDEVKCECYDLLCKRYSDEVKDDRYVHLFKGAVQESAEIAADCVSEWLSKQAGTPIGAPLISTQDLDCGIAIKSNELVASQECFESPTLFKTGWEMHVEVDPSFNMDCGIANLAAESESMAWSQCCKGPYEDWLTHTEGAYASLEWFAPPWSTFNEQWDPVCSNGF